MRCSVDEGLEAEEELGYAAGEEYVAADVGAEVLVVGDPGQPI